MLITVGWAALCATFTFSIAMVVWGRNGDSVEWRDRRRRQQPAASGGRSRR